MRVPRILIAVLMVCGLPMLANGADECLPDSPPKNPGDALRQLGLPTSAPVMASAVGVGGWKFRWPDGERHKLTMPVCVCVDYNQRSSAVSGEVWKEQRGPEWTRALIGAKGGTLNTPGGATVYWSECERKK